VRGGMSESTLRRNRTRGGGAGGQVVSMGAEGEQEEEGRRSGQRDRSGLRSWKSCAERRRMKGGEGGRCTWKTAVSALGGGRWGRETGLGRARAELAFETGLCMNLSWVQGAVGLERLGLGMHLEDGSVCASSRAEQLLSGSWA
jgi:hypothetical protein